MSRFVSQLGLSAGFDTVRSLRHLVDTATVLGERGIGFGSLEKLIDTTTPGGRLGVHIVANLAEFERDLIRDRTTAELEAAGARGRVGGYPTVLTAVEVHQLQRRGPATLVGEP